MELSLLVRFLSLFHYRKEAWRNGMESFYLHYIRNLWLRNEDHAKMEGREVMSQPETTSYRTLFNIGVQGLSVKQKNGDVK